LVCQMPAWMVSARGSMSASIFGTMAALIGW
jgi:hypothetical protein